MLSRYWFSAVNQYRDNIDQARILALSLRRFCSWFTAVNQERFRGGRRLDTDLPFTAVNEYRDNTDQARILALSLRRFCSSFTAVNEYRDNTDQARMLALSLTRFCSWVTAVNQERFRGGRRLDTDLLFTAVNSGPLQEDR